MRGFRSSGTRCLVSLATWTRLAIESFPVAALGRRLREGGVCAKEAVADIRAVKRMQASGGPREKRATSPCVRLCDGALTKGVLCDFDQVDEVGPRDPRAT